MKEKNHMKENLKTLTDKMAELKNKIIEAIENLPEANSAVTLLGKNCGTVSFSTIAKSPGLIMSPYYYLNGEVKRCLIKLVHSTRTENLDKMFEDILETGEINGKDITINPEFIAELKKIWED